MLGIDLGTSGCKAGLFTPRGALLALERSAYAVDRDAGGRAEQNCEDWWRGACLAARRALQSANVPPASIAAIGLSGQIGSQVLIDRQGRPLRPAVTWQDTRSGAMWPRLAGRFSRQYLADALGIDLPPGPAWPLPRLLWLQQTDPSALGRSWRLLQEKDYVAYRMTGELATDASSWRGLVHPLRSGPVAALLQALDLPADLLPPLRHPWELLGRVTAEAAAQTGVPAGTPVVTGWNDLNCALLGSGAVHSGTGFLIDGTSEHLGVTWDQDSPPGSRQLMFAPYLLAAPGGAPRVLYGVTSAGGGSLKS